MTDENKIQLADILIRNVQDFLTSEDIPVMVGKLNTPTGINGFDRAEIGHPVFEYKDRYIIFLTSGTGKTEVKIPYYKNTLKEVIDFL